MVQSLLLLKRFPPAHSLYKHRSDAGKNCLAKRAAQEISGAMRLSSPASPAH
jgi:hypothetical protein